MDPGRAKLLFGPYEPPRTRPGPFLSCEMRGKVKVYDFSDTPIPWPIGFSRCGRPTIMVCGDWVRAVQLESVVAVAYHWGVCSQTVSKWRQILEAERATPGTRRLLSYSIQQACTMEGCRKISRRRKRKAIPLSPSARKLYRWRLRQSWTPARRKRIAELTK